jgi:hypothetical protein
VHRALEPSRRRCCPFELTEAGGALLVVATSRLIAYVARLLTGFAGAAIALGLDQPVALLVSDKAFSQERVHMAVDLVGCRGFGRAFDLIPR